MDEININEIKKITALNKPDKDRRDKIEEIRRTKALNERYYPKYQQCIQNIQTSAKQGYYATSCEIFSGKYADILTQQGFNLRHSRADRGNMQVTWSE